MKVISFILLTFIGFNLFSQNLEREIINSQEENLYFEYKDQGRESSYKKSWLKIVKFLGLWNTYHNFFKVYDNELYRSAQLTKSGFEHVINKYNIKTIINLRGYHPNDKWYIDEKDVANQYNINFVTIPMSSDLLPTRTSLIKLLDSLENLEKPILVHCYRGADRTGEAATIYKMMKGETKKKALGMLSSRYWHLSIFMPAKRYFIKEIYKGALWARYFYYPCENNWKYFNKDSCNK